LLTQGRKDWTKINSILSSKEEEEEEEDKFNPLFYICVV
jgi:hypothetical protein